MKPSVQLTVKPDGIVEAEGINFKGPICDKKLNELLKLLEGKTIKESRKPDYHVKVLANINA